MIYAANVTAAKAFAGKKVAHRTRLQQRASARASLKVSAFKITLKTPDGEQVIECDEDTFILDAAEEAGIDLPYSCRSGSCSSCAGKIISGEIDQSDQTMLDDDQVAAGFSLLCVAYPCSDVVVETHKEEDVMG
ncbi:unnamed protein product [Pedinophyceae sp. YPF-701]|nr:unnamed protein product [Pedinophyceae sp. YPF-701]